MLLTMFLATALAGTVSLKGGEGCLSAVAIEVELDDVSGLLSTDRVFVDLVRLSDPWTLYVRVIRRELEVWKRALEVTPADCPLLPAALARTLERGLEGIPRWPFANERRRWLLGVQAVLSWPYTEWGAALTVGHGPRPRGVSSWEADVAVFTRSPQPVGPGRVTLTGLMVGIGPHAEGRIGATRLGVRPRLAVGFGRRAQLGIDQAPIGRGVALRVSGGLEGQVRLPQGMHFGIRTTLIVARTEYLSTVPIELPGDPQLPVTRVLEPAFRVGLLFGLRGPIGR